VKIVIPDDYPPVISGTKFLERLRGLGEVEVYTSKPESPEDLVKRIHDAVVVVNIRAYSRFDRSVLRKAHSLRLISVWETGLDNIDLQAASDLDITVTNTPNTATESVAEHTLTLMLATARRIPQIDSFVKQGKWVRGLVSQLHGKTLGVIGTGAIGGQVAKLGMGIGMKVVAWTFHPNEEWARNCGVEYVSIDRLLRESDVVSIHLRLTEETRELIDREKLSMMKPTAILVNTARGSIIDMKALVEALKAGRLWGAGLDVFEKEPLSPDDPLLKLENVVLTPHSAGQTAEVLDKGLNIAVDNVISWINGSPANVVNPK